MNRKDIASFCTGSYELKIMKQRVQSINRQIFFAHAFLSIDKLSEEAAEKKLQLFWRFSRKDSRIFTSTDILYSDSVISSLRKLPNPSY